MTNRTKFNFAIAVFLTGAAILGNIRPGSPIESGCPKELNLAYKTSQKHKNNIVFIGDSRTLTDVSPTGIGKYFAPSVKICNSGFSGQALDAGFLTFAYDNLTTDPNDLRIIVLQAAPSNLRKDKAAFPYSASLMPVLPIVYYFSDYYDSLTSAEIKKIANPDYVPDAVQEFYSNGWVATIINNRSAKFEGSYRDQAWPDRVGLISETANRIRQWRNAGIIVFVYQPPTSEKYLQKISRSDYDEKFVREQFEQAGAIWLNVPQTKYFCYDDSHLEKQAAVEFSDDFGAIIKNELIRLGKLPRE